MSNLKDLPRSRKDARSSGSEYYFTGEKCKFGHIDKRNTISAFCDSCEKEKNNPKRLFNRNMKNKESQLSAKNNNKDMTLSEINLITEKKENGKYRYTAENLAKMLNRTYASIGNCRVRYKST